MVGQIAPEKCTGHRGEAEQKQCAAVLADCKHRHRCHIGRDGADFSAYMAVDSTKVNGVGRHHEQQQQQGDEDKPSPQSLPVNMVGPAKRQHQH
jgi:hypothetical protein